MAVEIPAFARTSFRLKCCRTRAGAIIAGVRIASGILPQSRTFTATRRLLWLSDGLRSVPPGKEGLEPIVTGSVYYSGCMRNGDQCLEARIDWSTHISSCATQGHSTCGLVPLGSAQRQTSALLYVLTLLYLCLFEPARHTCFVPSRWRSVHFGVSFTFIPELAGPNTVSTVVRRSKLACYTTLRTPSQLGRSLSHLMTGRYWWVHNFGLTWLEVSHLP